MALDVYATEPCTDSPLFGLPNVLCTPHLGASTEEAQTNVAVEAAELLIDFFTTGAIKQSVNMSPLDPKTLEALRGYLNVAYRLGLLLAQVDHCPPSSCRLSYKGEVAKKDTRLLSAAFAAGLLQHAMAEGVNIVNAEVLLRERGIELVEERASRHRRLQLHDHRRGGQRRDAPPAPPARCSATTCPGWCRRAAAAWKATWTAR